MRWLVLLATLSCALIQPQRQQDRQAAPPDTRKWYHDRKSSLEFAQDKYACQKDAEPYYFRNDFSGSATVWRMCMEARGWELR